jgi:hypothetical protein
MSNHGRALFDQRQVNKQEISRATTGGAVAFRRNDNDRKAPRAVVTGALLGDPPSDLEQRRADAAHRAATGTSLVKRHEGPKHAHERGYI